METTESNSSQHKHKEEEEEECSFDRHDEKEEILKERISKHPLYRLLLEHHLQCLKVGGVNANVERKLRMELEEHCSSKTSTEAIDGSSELDHFMEAYCFALGKLKQAMEEPQTKSLAFVNDMHSQLRDLKTARNPTTATTVDAESVGSSSFSGDFLD